MSTFVTLLRAFVILLVCFISIPTELVHAESPLTMEWERQFGKSTTDAGYGVTYDRSGNIVFSGLAYGSGPNSSNYDAILGKYDGDGNLLWFREFGTPAYDASRGVALNQDGDIFIAGETLGDLGPTDGVDWDSFLSKFDQDGNMIWTRQLDASPWDGALDVTVDSSGYPIIAGKYGPDASITPYAGEGDGFVAKFDDAGNQLWIQQIGAMGYDDSAAVVTDALDNVYVVGSTVGSLGGPNAGPPDGYVTKLDSNGVNLWTRQFGGSNWDVSNAVTVDGDGNVTIGGYTRSNLTQQAIGDDAFLIQFNADGDQNWLRQFGTTDSIEDISVDEFGNLFVTGEFTPEPTCTGRACGSGDSTNLILIKLNGNGDELWSRMFGSSDRPSFASSIDIGVDGSVAIVGGTEGNLAGPSQGGRDFFLVKFSVPEPNSLLLVMSVTLGLLFPRKRSMR